jgi:hypothetical protein
VSFKELVEQRARSRSGSLSRSRSRSRSQVRSGPTPAQIQAEAEAKAKAEAETKAQLEKENVLLKSQKVSYPWVVKYEQVWDELRQYSQTLFRDVSISGFVYFVEDELPDENARIWKIKSLFGAASKTGRQQPSSEKVERRLYSVEGQFPRCEWLVFCKDSEMLWCATSPIRVESRLSRLGRCWMPGPEDHALRRIFQTMLAPRHGASTLRERTERCDEFFEECVAKFCAEGTTVFRCKMEQGRPKAEKASVDEAKATILRSYSRGTCLEISGVEDDSVVRDDDLSIEEVAPRDLFAGLSTALGIHAGKEAFFEALVRGGEKERGLGGSSRSPSQLSHECIRVAGEVSNAAYCENDGTTDNSMVIDSRRTLEMIQGFEWFTPKSNAKLHRLLDRLRKEYNVNIVLGTLARPSGKIMFAACRGTPAISSTFSAAYASDMADNVRMLRGEPPASANLLMETLRILVEESSRMGVQSLILTGHSRAGGLLAAGLGRLGDRGLRDAVAAGGGGGGGGGSASLAQNVKLVLFDPFMPSSSILSGIAPEDQAMLDRCVVSYASSAWMAFLNDINKRPIGMEVTLRAPGSLGTHDIVKINQMMASSSSSGGAGEGQTASRDTLRKIFDDGKRVLEGLFGKRILEAAPRIRGGSEEDFVKLHPNQPGADDIVTILRMRRNPPQDLEVLDPMAYVIRPHDDMSCIPLCGFAVDEATGSVQKVHKIRSVGAYTAIDTAVKKGKVYLAALVGAKSVLPVYIGDVDELGVLAPVSGRHPSQLLNVLEDVRILINMTSMSSREPDPIPSKAVHAEEKVAHAEEKVAHAEQKVAHAEQKVAHVEQKVAHVEKKEERVVHAEKKEERVVHAEEKVAHAQKKEERVVHVEETVAHAEKEEDGKVVHVEEKEEGESVHAEEEKQDEEMPKKKKKESLPQKLFVSTGSLKDAIRPYAEDVQESRLAPSIQQLIESLNAARKSLDSREKPRVQFSTQTQTHIEPAPTARSGKQQSKRSAPRSRLSARVLIR